MPKRKNLTTACKAEIVRRFYLGEKVASIGADYGVTGSSVSNIVGAEGISMRLALKCPHCSKGIGLTVKQDRVKYGRARSK